MMTNKKIRLGILVMTLAFGMITAGHINAQENGVGTALNGTWLYVEGGDTELKFNNGNFDLVYENTVFMSGVYTISGNEITLQLIQALGRLFRLDDRLYTKDQIITAVSDDIESDDIESFFSPATFAYSITGDTLSLIFDEYTETYTRKR